MLSDFLDVHGHVHHIHSHVLLSMALGWGVHGYTHDPCISLDAQLANNQKIHG